MAQPQHGVHGSESVDPRFAEERAAMVAEILAEVTATEEWTGRKNLAPAVVESLSKTPRHEFVPVNYRDAAYINHALPIGCDQTISQPYIVALMTDLLEPQSNHVILEIGTGSGYQAAVLSSLVRHIYTVEVVPELAERARSDLARLGYRNVDVRCGDGALGWPERAPFDGVIVTAAATEAPPALIAQLRPGGRLVIPVGLPGGQQLTVFEKSPDGSVDSRAVLPVAFVPFTSPR